MRTSGADFICFRSYALCRWNALSFCKMVPFLSQNLEASERGNKENEWGRTKIMDLNETKTLVIASSICTVLERRNLK